MRCLRRRATGFLRLTVKPMTPLSSERYAALVLRYRWPILVLATLLMLAMTGGARFIGVTNDYRSLFEADNPQLKALDALEATFATSNAALIAIAPQQGSVFTREALGAVEELTKAGWETPYSSRVDSLTNYTHSEADGDDLVVRPLVENARDLDDAGLAGVKSIALSASELAGRLVSRDGRVGGLVITFVLPENPDSAVIEITDYLRATLDKARTDHPQIRYYLTGDVVMNRAFADTTQEDLRKLAPIVFLIIAVVAATLLRSVWGTVASLVVLVFILNSTVGFAGWIGTVFGPANSGLPIIVMTVAIAHSIHIVASALAGMRRGLNRKAAIVESLQVNMRPVFLTSLTTAIGFLSLNFSDSPPFRQLGNLVAFGVLCAFVYSTVPLPALLSVLPLRARLTAEGKPGFFDRFGDFVVRRRTVLLWSSILVALGLVAGIPRIELADNWTQYFDERYEFRRDTDFIVQNLTGMETLEYSLDSGSEGGITNPAYLRKVEAFAKWYRGQPEVTHVQAFSEIMKRLNKNTHGDDPAFYQLPDDGDLASQYLLLYELSLPFGSDLNNRIDVAKSRTRMTVVLRNTTSRDQRALDAHARAWLSANAAGLATEASGVSIVFAHLSQRNVESMLRGTIAAMALVSVILILVFRSLRLGLISLVPNFIPAAAAFGLWGFLVGQVGLAASVVTAMVFGIIVDDTIHFMSKYSDARRQGLAPPEAVRAAFRTVGHALWTTSAILALGFLVFASSGFELSWALGLLTAITIGFALIADFLLLPPLLMALDRRKP